MADQRPLFDDAAPQPASPARKGKRTVTTMPVATSIGREALAALRRAVVGHDHVDLGAPQDPRFKLSRSVYDEAAQVLETIGAKWHAGRKRHVFTESWDAGMFADVLETGEAPPVNPLAYFATPAAVADDMLAQRPIARALAHFGEVTVLEPSAGTGALALAAARAWSKWAREQDEIQGAHPVEWYTASLPRLRLVLVELDERRARILRSRVVPQIEAVFAGRIRVEVVVGDFLTLTREQLGEPRAVVMNPPFSVAGDKIAWWTHLQHALAIVHPRGAIACIVPPTFRWQVKLADALALISRAVAWPIPAGAFKQAGTDLATWALTLDVECAGEPAPGAAVEVIASTHHLNVKMFDAVGAQRAWGEPAHGDPTSTWGRTVLEVTRAVALGEDSDDAARATAAKTPPHDKQRNGEPVSFSREFQAALSRELWAYFSTY